MREAIARAEVGDEQRRLDPTTILLEERVAELLGHEATVFLPSGTMCNVVALLVRTSAAAVRAAASLSVNRPLCTARISPRS